MLSLENAPRLVLGMWSTAAPDDATVFFAKAARRSKSMPDAPFEVSDLTAALSQIQGHAEDEIRFEFKVPANELLFASDVRVNEGDEEAFAILLESINCLLEWKWFEAIALSKQTLLKTETESIRDEALNVMAAGLALSGDVDAGIAALKKAAEGEWNFSLQQNLGILALRVDPELAANQSTYWLDSAESAEDRQSAIFFVLKMWSSWENDSEFELPIRIRDSFRMAVRQDLSVNTFSMLGMFLARQDSEWISKQSNWDSSPNFHTEVTGMISARAEGVEEFISFLAKNARSADAQIAQARSNFISEMIESMMEEESALWVVTFSMNLVESGLPCDSMNNALLRVLAVREICLYMRENGGEPKDIFADWLIDVLRFNATLQDPDLREFLDDMLMKASTLYTLAYLRPRMDELEQFFNPLTTVHAMSQRWSTKRRLNKPEARQMATELRNWSIQVNGQLEKLRLLPALDEQMSTFVTDLAKNQRTVQQMSNDILGSI